MANLLVKIIVSPLKFILRWCFNLIVFALIILAIILGTGNHWLPKVIPVVTKKCTDFNAHIEQSKGNLFKGHVAINDFSITNPKDSFEKLSFLRFNELEAKVNLCSVLKDTIILDKVVIDIDNFSLVTNKKGVMNAKLLVDNIQSMLAQNDLKSDSTETTSSPKNFLIRTLVFKLESADLFNEKTNSSNHYDIHYSVTINDITNENMVSKLMTIGTALAPYGLSACFSMFLDVLPGLNQVTGVVGNAAGKVGNAVGSVVDTGKSLLKGFDFSKNKQ